jgi:aryl-phospho-beta-D-glucosidase BglC (GH1 family)
VLITVATAAPARTRAALRPGENLTRGVNLSGWFWYGPEDAAGIRARFNDADFKQMRTMGLTFVRLAINLPEVMDDAAPDLLDVAGIALLDESIRRVQAAKLAVIVDIHSTSLEDSAASNYSARLENPEFFKKFVAFWRSFASHLTQFDPATTYLGLMNEPVFEDDPAQWPPLQAQLVSAVRAAAPQHTIIVTGALWSSWETLVNLEPLKDENLIYDFHFYEPFPFTHQGATWTSPAVRSLSNVPYPSSPEAMKDLIAAQTDPEAREMLRQYGEEAWEASSIRWFIEQTYNWAQKHNVRLICSEFGAYRDGVPHKYRVRWLTDMIAAFDEFGIGWAMWDFDGNFGLATRNADGSLSYDADILAALGLARL